MNCCLIFYIFYGIVCSSIASLFSFAACLSEEEDLAIIKANSINGTARPADKNDLTAKKETAHLNIQHAHITNGVKINTQDNTHSNATNKKTNQDRHLNNHRCKNSNAYFYTHQPNQNEKRLPPAIIQKKTPAKWTPGNDLAAISQIEFLAEMDIPYELAVEIVTALHDESHWNDTNATRLNAVMNKLLEIHNSQSKNNTF